MPSFEWPKTSNLRFVSMSFAKFVIPFEFLTIFARNIPHKLTDSQIETFGEFSEAQVKISDNNKRSKGCFTLKLSPV